MQESQCELSFRSVDQLKMEELCGGGVDSVDKDDEAYCMTARWTWDFAFWGLSADEATRTRKQKAVDFAMLVEEVETNHIGAVMET
jgi:hypothetical protein